MSTLRGRSTAGYRRSLGRVSGWKKMFEERIYLQWRTHRREIVVFPEQAAACGLSGIAMVNQNWSNCQGQSVIFHILKQRAALELCKHSGFHWQRQKLKARQWNVRTLHCGLLDLGSCQEKSLQCAVYSKIVTNQVEASSRWKARFKNPLTHSLITPTDTISRVPPVGHCLACRTSILDNKLLFTLAACSQRLSYLYEKVACEW